MVIDVNWLLRGLGTTSTLYKDFDVGTVPTLRLGSRRLTSSEKESGCNTWLKGPLDSTNARRESKSCKGDLRVPSSFSSHTGPLERGPCFYLMVSLLLTVRTLMSVRVPYEVVGEDESGSIRDREKYSPFLLQFRARWNRIYWSM